VGKNYLLEKVTIANNLKNSNNSVNEITKNIEDNLKRYIDDCILIEKNKSQEVQNNLISQMKYIYNQTLFKIFAPVNLIRVNEIGIIQNKTLIPISQFDLNSVSKFIITLKNNITVYTQIDSIPSNMYIDSNISLENVYPCDSTGITQQDAPIINLPLFINFNKSILSDKRILYSSNNLENNTILYFVNDIL
jgi:hypothetical protein